MEREKNGEMEREGEEVGEQKSLFCIEESKKGR